MVGHSGHHLYHEETFNMIKHFDAINVICPLTYGGNEYIERVVRVGNAIFGDRFIALRDHLKYDDYTKLMCSVTVAVFHNKEQQAMGNINLLLALGKKVYLREGNSMWKHYTKMGYKLFPTSVICSQSLEEFRSFDAHDRERNIEIATAFWSSAREDILSAWQHALNAIAPSSVRVTPSESDA